MKNINTKILRHRFHLFLFLQYGKKIFHLILHCTIYLHLYIYIIYIYTYIYIYIYIYISNRTTFVKEYGQEYAVLPHCKIHRETSSYLISVFLLTDGITEFKGFCLPYSFCKRKNPTFSWSFHAMRVLDRVTHCLPCCLFLTYTFVKILSYFSTA